MKKIIYILVTIFVAGGLFYRFVYTPKTTYETQEVKVGDFVKDVFATGVVDSEVIFQVSSNATGRVSGLFAKESQHVKRGDMLAKIDPVDLNEKIKEEEQAILKAISNKDISKNRIQDAQAKLELADLMLKRYEKLLEGGFVSNVEYDNIKLSQISAKANLNTLKNEESIQNSEIERMRYSTNALKLKLKELTLLAPHDGIVVKREVEVGDTALAGKALFKIVNPDSVWIKAFIDEAQSGEITKGQKASIVVRSRQNKPMDGYVKEIDFISDSVTEERELGIAFSKTPQDFFLNEQAEVKINVANYKNVLLVLAKNIVKHESKNGVWLYRDGKANFVPVKILAKSISSDFVAVEGSLKHGDKLLVPSENKKPLKDGLSVKI